MKTLTKTRTSEQVVDTTVCKKRDREGSCRRLLDAGLEVFSKYGYDAATTKLVAKQAGINESLINRYFEGKEGLLLALIRQFFESEKESGAFHYPAGKTLEQEILNFSTAMFEHHAKVHKFFKVVISRAIVDSKIGEEMKCSAEGGFISLLAERLAAFQKRKVIRADVDLDHACFIIKHTCFSLGFLGPFVMGLDNDYIRATLADFVRDYSAGISAKRA